MDVIVSRRSKTKVFHSPNCPYAKRIGAYRKTMPEEIARCKGYKACTWCGGSHGLYLRLKNSPGGYPPELSQMSISYDKQSDAVCFRTDEGFWKLRWKNYENGYKLFHLNHEFFNKEKTDKELMGGKFHRQKDVDVTKKVGAIIKYIFKHDRAKKIIDNDWRKLPKGNKQQKRYYEQAKKRARRAEHRRLDELFQQIQEEYCFNA